MPLYAYLLLLVGTILWSTPFFIARTTRPAAIHRDKRARWGIALQVLSYSLLWQGSFWERRPEAWQIIVSCCLFALACAISWTGAHALGRQFRFDAAVGDAHQLVRSGPYRLIRHPLYASMLCVMLATGLLLSQIYLFLALAVFLIGSEIRMRVEDKLLESQFGAQFEDYRRTVPRLIPFLK